MGCVIRRWVVNLTGAYENIVSPIQYFKNLIYNLLLYGPNFKLASKNINYIHFDTLLFDSVCVFLFKYFVS